MQDLTLVGMHDDGERLLLSTAGGDRFTLAVDDALRAAVRGDRSRLGQIQLETERMRPRDIQARIRAGQTAEDVAAAGDVPLDYVRRYEGAVLAERGYVASQARKVQIRRGALAAATTPTLGELVDERLRRREVDPEQSAWDAWRGDDGTWTVQVDFPVGAKRRQACWVYNPPLKQVLPLDDESRWLTDGDGRDRDARPPRGRRDDDPAPDGGGRRLTVASVTSSQDTDALETGAEERDLLDALVETESVSGPSLELLDTLRERRGRRLRPLQGEEDGDEPDPVESAIESILAMRDAALTPDPPGEDSSRSGPQRSSGRSNARPATGRGSATSGDGAPRTASRHPAGKALGRDDARPASTSTAASATESGGRAPSPPPAPRSSRPPQRTAQRTLEVPAPEPASSPSPERSGTVTSEEDETSAATPGRAGSTGRATSPARKTRRASVPSWDEIILGARRD